MESAPNPVRSWSDAESLSDRHVGDHQDRFDIALSAPARVLLVRAILVCAYVTVRKGAVKPIPASVDANPSEGIKIRDMTVPPDVSIIVPTFGEADNLASLVERVFQTLHGDAISGELIIVDDNSQDGTVETVERLSRFYPVRAVVRPSEHGLSSAVLRGFAEAKADRFVVLDADLQHPPEKIPELLRGLDEPPCDFAIGSRYILGAGVEDRWPVHRRLVSRVATLFARPLAPLSDPMSGFFALRRETWLRARHALNPVGYKIALELYVKCGCRHPVEVPIRFAVRQAGKSKLNLRTQWSYLRHLARLYRFKYPIGMSILWMALLGALLLVGWKVMPR